MFEKESKQYSITRTYPKFENSQIANFVLREVEGAYWQGANDGYNKACDEAFYLGADCAKKTHGYRSVKDALPPSDGLFYDVMGILWNDNICGGYNYHRGQYQNGFFFFDHSMYLQKEDFRNSNTQKKVIAWKPLLKCTSDQITEFREKQGVL